MPIEYYEFARGIAWSIPYLCLPWETGATDSFMEESSFPENTYSRLVGGSKLGIYKPSSGIKGNLEVDNSLYGIPLAPVEYRSFLEVGNSVPLSYSCLSVHNTE